MVAQRTKYDKEFKQKLVELSRVRGNTKKVAEEYGISPGLLYRWRSEAQEHDFKRTPSQRKLKTTNLERDSSLFSIRGLISSGLFGFITWLLIKAVREIDSYEELYKEDWFFQLLVEWVKSQSKYDAQQIFYAYQGLKSMVILLLISNIIKTMISLRHAFLNQRNNSKYLLFNFFILEAICIGFCIGFDPIKEYVRTIFFIGIPTYIGFFLLQED